MDYDRMRNINFANLANTIKGGGVSFRQFGRVVLIGSGHDADAEEELRKDVNFRTGSIDKVDYNQLEVHGCRNNVDEEDFGMEIGILELKQYGNSIHYNIRFM